MLRILSFLLLLFTVQFVPSGKNIPRSHTVEIKGMQFVPAVLDVRKGDTVVWVNRDVVLHNVTEKTGSWASSPIRRNTRWEKRILSSADYYCSLHPVMKGRIQVKK